MTSDNLSLSRHFQEAKLFCSTSKDVEFVCRPFGRPATDKLRPTSSYFALEAKAYNITVLRWLDTVFLSEYLSCLSVNYVAINKDLEKLTPQLY